MNHSTPASRAICITGMYRSGTSLVARVINLLGGDIGPETELLPPKPENPTGFWERQDLYDLHERILEHLGLSWDTPLPLPGQWLEELAMDRFRDELTGIIRAAFATSPLWAVKDPRLSLLLPLWQDVLQRLAIPFTVLHVLRHPLDVAASLKTRDNFSLEKSLGIWFNYNAGVIRTLGGPPQIVVTYEEMISDWPKTVNRLLPALPDNLRQAPNAETTRRIAEFILPELCHGRQQADKNTALLPDSVKTLYDYLRGLSQGKAPLQQETINRLLRQHGEHAEFFRRDLLDVAQSEHPPYPNPQNQTDILQKEKQITDLTHRLAEKNRRIEALTTSYSWQITDPLRRIGKWIMEPGHSRRQLEKLVDHSFPAGTDRRRVFDGFAFRAAGLKLSISQRLKQGSIDYRLAEEIAPLTFVTEPAPRVSIIIPVFNNFRHTYTCLASIHEHSANIPYEIIVVDDGSSDETTSLAEVCHSLNLIRLNTNTGFVRACNMGARVARGEFILLLNNDTKVTAGWLKALLRPLDADPTIAVVGARLIYPDGRLQEAGGVVWNNEKYIGMNYGRGRTPEHHEFTYLKDVDYCSAACLLIRGSVFRRIGGLDTRFAPAYCEDTDLAFAVRQLGLRVVYQPRAVIIHFEGRTAGRQTFAGIKRYQALNQRKFYQKWQSVLQRDHLPGPDDLYRARDRSQGKKILLFVDHYVPMPDQDAGSLLTRMYLDLFLEMNVKIVFLPDNRYRTQPYTNDLQQAGIEVLYGNVRPLDYIRRNGRHFDLVWLSRPHISVKYVAAIKKHTRAPIWYCMHDLHYRREERRYAVEKDPRIKKAIERWRRLELAMFAAADCVLTLNDQEQAIIQTFFPDSDVRLIPGYIFKRVPAGHGHHREFTHRRDLLFLGGFNHPPNIDAILYFIERIFPLIRKKLPDIRIHVVGSQLPQSIRRRQTDQVLMTGYLPDLDDIFNSIRVFVSPLRYGAGLKGKNVLSMAHGVPMVTTTVGNEGLGLVDGQQAMIADRPEGFAEKVIQLYSDPVLWRTLSQAGMDVVRDRFSKDAARQALPQI